MKALNLTASRDGWIEGEGELLRSRLEAIWGYNPHFVPRLPTLEMISPRMEVQPIYSDFWSGARYSWPRAEPSWLHIHVSLQEPKIPDGPHYDPNWYDIDRARYDIKAFSEFVAVAREETLNILKTFGWRVVNEEQDL
jgi:hypothetical protein